LAPHIKPAEPLYIFLRTSQDAIAAVTYVPNEAHVRKKTLFASTRLTLTRTLGAANFSESVFVTEAKELTPEGWNAHEAHVAAENPLTEEERGFESIREAEINEVGGTGRRGAGYGPGTGGKTMDADGDALAALKGLEKGDVVGLKIDEKEHIVLADSIAKGVSPGQVSSHIANDAPRYTIYGGETGSAIFIYTCPSGSKPRDRMMYASSRRSAEALATVQAGLTLTHRVEFSDPSEVDVQALENEIAPKEEVKTGFSKPKRPGRR
jgi:twinfilin-like protein